MMAEMIATYNAPSAGAKPAAATTPASAEAMAGKPASGNGNGNGRGYLNEVSPLTAREHLED